MQQTMDFDMKIASNFNDQEVISVPFFLPRLFASPSCLPEFSKILATLVYMKAELVKITVKLHEAIFKKEDETIEKFFAECACLRSEIDVLECEAKKMRTELVDRIYVEVGSVNEMKAVNELRFGIGAGAIAGMRCFRGKVYVSSKIPKEVFKAMAIVERLGQTF